MTALVCMETLAIRTNSCFSGSISPFFAEIRIPSFVNSFTPSLFNKSALLSTSIIVPFTISSLSKASSLASLSGFPASFDAHILQRVIRVAHTGGIDEAEEDPVDDKRIFDRVARRTLYIAHDSALLTE